LPGLDQTSEVLSVAGMETGRQTFGASNSIVTHAYHLGQFDNEQDQLVVIEV